MTVLDDLAAAFDLATRARAAHPYPVFSDVPEVPDAGVA